jgi:large subunit ribosomal protein L21
MEAYAIFETGGKQYKVETGNEFDVEAEVITHKRGQKVVAFKKKRRKGYRRKVGHRQELTRLKITNISA